MKKAFILYAIILLTSCNSKPHSKGRSYSRVQILVADSSNKLLIFNTLKIVLDTVVEKDFKYVNIQDSVYMYIFPGDTIRGKDNKPMIDSITHKVKVTDSSEKYFPWQLVSEINQRIYHPKK